MNSFEANELTEDVFGHLCNIAIDKCNDKMEKRRAGCGGPAMRKRVLIKNFVTDLFKTHKERSLDEDVEDCSVEYRTSEHDDEYDDGSEDMDRTLLDESLDGVDEDDSELVDEDSLEDELPRGDCWLSSHTLNTPVFGDYLMNHENSLEESDVLSPSERPSISPRHSLHSYQLYSNLSENANEGGRSMCTGEISQGEYVTHTVPADVPYDTCRYEFSHPYELDSLPSLALGSLEMSGGVQAVNADLQDQVFLSMTNHRYSQMTSYTTLYSSSNETEDVNEMPTDIVEVVNVVDEAPQTPSFFDLDTSVTVSHTLTPKKRRSNESCSSMYDMCVLETMTQKRLKL